MGILRKIGRWEGVSSCNYCIDLGLPLPCDLVGGQPYLVASQKSSFLVSLGSLIQLGTCRPISGVSALVHSLLGYPTPQHTQGFEILMLHPLTHLLSISTGFLLHIAINLGRSVYPSILWCLCWTCLGGLHSYCDVVAP